MKRSLDTYHRDKLDPARKTGLIMCGMGGPDGPETVEPFLRNLFADPAILPLPRVVAGLVGRMIARKRAPKVRKNYAAMDQSSVSPQLETTRQQAIALAERLSESGRGAIAGVAMRYWHPFPAETVAELMGAGAQQFLIVPAYPQFSWATNGSTLDFVLDGLGHVAPAAPVHIIPDWHLLSGYLDALARPIIETLTGWAKEDRDPRQCGLLYVAHSLPERCIRQGDPYLDRTRETAQAVHRIVTRVMGAAEFGPWLEVLRAGGHEPQLAFQSKVGPVTWLGPEISDEVSRVAADGVRSLCVQPVSFTCEHIETLLELDIELRATADRAGVVNFVRGPALNLNTTWLDSLAALLTQEAFSPEVGRIVADA